MLSGVERLEWLRCEDIGVCSSCGGLAAGYLTGLAGLVDEAGIKVTNVKNRR